jgi:hypothetical protein
MAEKFYRTHLTPRGWQRGSRPADALESWEVRMVPNASDPLAVRARLVWTERESRSGRKSEALKLARINHARRPRTD